MRILHCISSLSGGGAERQLSYLAPELVSNGIETHIIYLSDGPTPPEFSGTGVIIHKINAYNNYDPRIIIGIIVCILEIKPQLIQTWIVQMDVVVGFIVRLINIPWIFREANSEEAAKYRGRKETLRRFVSHWATCIVANSQSGLEYWKKINPTKKLINIENGIPLKVLNYKQGVSQNNTKNTIVFAGRLKAHKNIETLLRAFSMSNFDKNIQLLICGTGIQESYLKSVTYKLNIADQTEFLGHVDQDRLLTLLSNALLFVNPSTYEGCPNTVLEAMSCLCPVAVSLIDAHKAILDEDSAWFFEPYDTASLSGILNIVKEPMKLQDQAKKARVLIGNYTVDRMAKKYIEIYNDILE